MSPTVEPGKFERTDYSNSCYTPLSVRLIVATVFVYNVICMHVLPRYFYKNKPKCKVLMNLLDLIHPIYIT